MKQRWLESMFNGLTLGVIFLNGLSVLGNNTAADQDITQLIDDYNVVWHAPGLISADSMPIGNGDVGLNVWTETNGDVAFYIGKSDAWNEDVFGDRGLMKLGGVRISLEPNRFMAGSPFSQTLKLREGAVEVQQGYGNGKVILRIWVDANNPVIRVEATSQEQPVSLKVRLTDWRLHDGNPDKLLNKPDRIAWFHRNGSQANPNVADLTFGAVIKGDGLTNSGPETLVSANAAKYQLVSICPLTLKTAGIDEWQSKQEEQINRVDSLNFLATWTAHKKWWDDFWHRSWIFVSGDEMATNVTRGYILQRFVTACAGRGAYPIKFNGSLFVVDDPIKHHTADSRDWGGQYWFQNTRPVYWPRLAAGDFDMMLPLFKMYQRQLAPNAEQVSKYYGHNGSYFAETAPFWGGLKYWGPEVKEDWTGHYFTPILELSMMMLDYYEYTGDRNLAKNTLLPVATAGLEFFDRHFKRGKDGKILLEPDNAIEMYWKVRNPAPDIAGLRAILPRMIALPYELVTSAMRTNWERMLKEVPELPLGIVNGRKAILPYSGEQTARIRNGENPELYSIYPFRLYGLGMPDLQLALDTFKARKMTQKGCWVQDPVQAAMLGLSDVAKEYVVFNANRKEPRLKFPAFWAKANDYPPDEDNGGNLENGLQQMLIQCVGEKILLLPAWPKEWDANFKLNAPFGTTVQAKVEHGKLSDVIVNPAKRAADVSDMSAQTSAETTSRQAIRMACVGDSIVFGAGVENREKNNWPAVLGTWLGENWDVRNFGVNGATMLMKGDFPYRKQDAFEKALKFQPDVVIISLGANDSKHPTDKVKDAVNNWQFKEGFTGDYEEMIASFKAVNPRVIVYVCTPLPAYPGNWGINDTTIRDEVAPMIKQVAKETGAPVIDLYGAMSDKPELFPDTVHPNAIGARLVAGAAYHSLTGKQHRDAVYASARDKEPDAGSVKSILSPRDRIFPLKQTASGHGSIFAQTGDFGGMDGNDELVGNAIDGNTGTKYFNKGKTDGGFPGAGTGFVITPSVGGSIVTAVQFATANDEPQRDPVEITVEGANDARANQKNANNFTLIYAGTSGLKNDPGRSTWGHGVVFANTNSYMTYRVLVTRTREAAEAAQYAEVRLGSTAHQ